MGTDYLGNVYDGGTAGVKGTCPLNVCITKKGSCTTNACFNNSANCKHNFCGTDHKTDND